MSTILPDAAYIFLTGDHLCPYQQELEVTRRWILDKLSWAQPPDMITQLVEAAYYCLEMPLFIVAVGVTIPVPGTGETALQIGTVRQPMALAPGIE